MNAGERPQRTLPARRVATFDVISWLADLLSCDVHDVRYVNERERSGVLAVTYDCAGTPAELRLRHAGGVAAAAWELTANAAGALTRIVVPGGTRFQWRPPRGTHL